MLALNSVASENNSEALEKLKIEGEQLFSAGDYRAAEKTWEIGLELSKSSNNQQFVSLLLVKLGEVNGEMGIYDIAFDRFEQALKVFKSEDDEKDCAQVYLKISQMYEKLDKYKEAMSTNEKAIEIFKKLGTKEELAMVFQNAGQIYLDRHDYGGALAYLNESLNLALETGNKDLYGNSLLGLGKVNRAVGNCEKAKSYCEEAVTAYQSVNNPKGSAAALINIGLVQLTIGDYKSAISSFENSLDVCERLGDKTKIETNLANLGTTYKSLCDYSKAVLYFENAMRYASEINSSKSILEGYLNLGAVYESIGCYDKAAAYFNEALKMYRSMGDNNGMASTFLSLGGCYCDKWDCRGAINCYQQAADIRKKSDLDYQEIYAHMVDYSIEKGDIDFAVKQSRMLKDKLRQGKIELYNKNYTTSEECFEQAVQDNTANRKNELLFPSYCGLAESYLELWQYDKAKEIFNEAINIVEAQRDNLDTEEKRDYFSSTIAGVRKSTPYEGIIRTQMSTNDVKNAFTFSDGLKLAIFAESVADTDEFGGEKLSAEDAKKEEYFKLKIKAIRREMDLLFKNSRKDEYWAKDRELKVLLAARNEFVESLRKTNPEYTFIKYPKPLKYTDINLKPNETLFEFEVTKEVAYLFVYSGLSKRFITRTIPKTRLEIVDIVNKYRSFLKKDLATGELAVFDGKYSNEIYNMLFGETLKSVPKGSTLVIVPDEALGALPFGSLVVSLPESEKIAGGKYGTFPVGAQYLSDNYLITYAQSASALTFLRSKKTPVAGNQALSVCDPALVLDAGNSRGSDKEYASGTMGAIDSWSQERCGQKVFKRLEMTNALVSKMDSMFPGKSTVLSDGDAKRDKFIQSQFSKYRFITFGTLAVLDSGLPWLRQPSIILSQTGNNDDNNGFLSMNDIIKLNIPAQAAVISGCETATGEGVTGEHVMNMGRCFQHCGCGNVLMSLWPMLDDTAVTCDSVFLQNLKDGKEPAEALKNAREEIRGSGFEHPYYWASFILVSR